MAPRSRREELRLGQFTSVLGVLNKPYSDGRRGVLGVGVVLEAVCRPYNKTHKTSDL